MCVCVCVCVCVCAGALVGARAQVRLRLHLHHPGISPAPTACRDALGPASDLPLTRRPSSAPPHAEALLVAVDQIFVFITTDDDSIFHHVAMTVPAVAANGNDALAIAIAAQDLKPSNIRPR